MRIYLTEQELDREEHLFKPHELRYEILSEAAFDLTSLEDQEAERQNKQDNAASNPVLETFVPPSC